MKYDVPNAYNVNECQIDPLGLGVPSFEGMPLLTLAGASTVGGNVLQTDACKARLLDKISPAGLAKEHPQITPQKVRIPTGCLGCD